MKPTQDELECGADALRRFEMSGRMTREWSLLPVATKKKWLVKAAVVTEAVFRERERAARAEAMS